MNFPTPLTKDITLKAGYCEHGLLEMRQGVSKGGKVWRGEFCSQRLCEPMFWRWNEQIDLWITPMYEPNDFMYLGVVGSPWEHLDPQPKEEINER